MPAPSLPAPVANDPDTGGFWRAAADGAVAICTCAACAATLHLPRSYCSSCGGHEVTWREVEPTGTVYTFTIVERQVDPRFPAPYVIVLVALDAMPGVRLLGHVPGRQSVKIGTPVRATFQHRGDVVIPNWELVGSNEPGGQ